MGLINFVDTSFTALVGQNFKLFFTKLKENLFRAIEVVISTYKYLKQ